MSRCADVDVPYLRTVRYSCYVFVYMLLSCCVAINKGMPVFYSVLYHMDDGARELRMLCAYLCVLYSSSVVPSNNPNSIKLRFDDEKGAAAYKEEAFIYIMCAMLSFDVCIIFRCYFFLTLVKSKHQLLYYFSLSLFSFCLGKARYDVSVCVFVCWRDRESVYICIQ